MMVGTNINSTETAKLIPVNSIGAEIGVWKGATSEKFLKVGLAHLHLVDPWSLTPWFDNLTPDLQEKVMEKYSSKLVKSKSRKDFQKYYDNVYDSVCKKFNKPNVTIHRKSSKDFFNEFKGELDWIYIDGDHSYEGCLYDLQQSLKIVKKGGLIMADDYGNKGAVKNAINDFIKEHNLQLTVFANNQVKIEVK